MQHISIEEPYHLATPITKIAGLTDHVIGWTIRLKDMLAYYSDLNSGIYCLLFHWSYLFYSGQDCIRKK